MNEATTSTIVPTGLVGLREARTIVFGEGGPSERTWNEWKFRKYFPVVKIGGRVFVDPAEVRAALERRFKRQAVPAK